MGIEIYVFASGFSVGFITGIVLLAVIALRMNDKKRG